MKSVSDSPYTLIDQAATYANFDHEQPLLSRFIHGKLAIYTHRSPHKALNEDALAVVPINEHSGILVIADGVGGQPRGELAAQTLVETISAIAINEPKSLREAILRGIDQANHSIMDSGSGGGATLAVLEISGRNIRPYHVGDALIIVMGQRGKIKFQNVAHSPVGYAVESGLIDEDEAVHHHQRNLVSNIVGSPSMFVDIGPRLKLAPRDTVVIASDGLSDNLYTEEIIATTRAGSISSAAQNLQARTRRRMAKDGPGLPSHPDDLSFCLFRLDAGYADRQMKMSF